MLDLTPFGFTPTETATYGALLELGPSSGYAVARALSIARANAYQALDGLVSKGAATLLAEGSPRRYRAVQPRSVFTQIMAAETRKLDVLERQLLEQPKAGAAPVTVFSGERALHDLVVRAIIRAEEPVRCLASAERLGSWAPAMRARAAGGRPLEVWVGDGGAADLPVPAGAVPAERVHDLLGDDAVLLRADGSLIGRFGAEPEGIWSESTLVGGVVDAALNHLTG